MTDIIARGIGISNKKELENVASQLAENATVSIADISDKTTLQNEVDLSSTVKLILKKQKTYNFTDLSINKTNFILNGNFSTIDGNLIVSGENIEIKNIIFDSSKDKPFILVGDVKSLKITNCKFSHKSTTYGGSSHACILFMNATTRQEDIEIKNCDFETPNATNGIDGIKGVGNSTATIKNLKIENCNFELISRMGIEILNYFQNVDIEKCTFKNSANSPITMSHHMGISLSGSNGYDGSIKKCMFDGVTGFNVEIVHMKNAIVEDCSFSNTTADLISISGTGQRNIIITNNKAVDFVGGKVKVQQAKEVFIQNNIFRLNRYVELINCSFCKIENNKIETKDYYGISIDQTSDSEVYNNTLDTTQSPETYRVIQLYASSTTRNIIQNNRIIKNSQGSAIGSVNGATENITTPNTIYTNNVANSSPEIIKSGHSGNTTLKIINNNSTTQKFCLFEIKWASRSGESPRGGVFTLAFGSHSTPGAMPVKGFLGTEVTVSVSTNAEGKAEFLITIPISSGVGFIWYSTAIGQYSDYTITQ